MPEGLKWFLRNYRVSLTFYGILVVAIFLHATILGYIIERKMRETRAVRLELVRQANIMEHAADVFQNAAQAISQATRQAASNFDVIKANHEILLRLEKRLQAIDAEKK